MNAEDNGHSPVDETVAFLIVDYAEAIIHEDERGLLVARAGLDAIGLHFSGYVGAPVLHNGRTPVAQIIFNFNKDMSINKRNPYRIDLRLQPPV